MKVARGELWTGRLLLVVLMAVTVLPFLSLFTTAPHPSGSVPGGLEWPADPQWGNFVKAFNQSSMGTLMVSSLTIVLGVVPIALVISTMAGFAIGHLRIPGGGFLLLLFIFGLTLPFEVIITPLYYIARQLGILNTRLAIILPLIDNSIYTGLAAALGGPPEPLRRLMFRSLFDWRSIGLPITLLGLALAKQNRVKEVIDLCAEAAKTDRSAKPALVLITILPTGADCLT